MAQDYHVSLTLSRRRSKSRSFRVDEHLYPVPPKHAMTQSVHFNASAHCCLFLKLIRQYQLCKSSATFLLFFVHTHLRESIPPIKRYQFGPTDGNCERRHAKSQSKY